MSTVVDISVLGVKLALLLSAFCVPDATYSDPLGPQVERPKTAASRRHEMQDEFGDEELGDDLLPE